MTPNYHLSIEVYRPTFGADGRNVFGAALATVSGSIWRTPDKVLTVGEGEVFVTNAQGFVDRAVQLKRRDHLKVIAPAAISGERFEVYSVISGHNQFGTVNHVGVTLRATRLD